MKARDVIPAGVLAALCAAMGFVPSASRVALDDGESMRARVVETDESLVTLTGYVEYGTQRLKVEMLDGPAKGKTFAAANELRAQLDIDKKFAVGDVASVTWPKDGAQEDEVLVARDHHRLGWMAVLFGAFAALLVVFAGWTGAKALFSFVFSCFAVWKLMVPLCLDGWSASWVAFATVSVLTAVIMYLVAGATRKGVAAFFGAMLGIGSSLVLAHFFARVMHVNGATMPFVQALLHSGYAELDMADVFIGAIILASSGAVMDLAMDIAAGIGEVKRHRPELPRAELFLSGVRIGRSVVGTMTTTLLLAYSGGYLTLLMVFAAQGTHPLDFINSTLVSAEVVKTLVGSFGLVLVAPFTALVGAAVYGRNPSGRGGGLRKLWLAVALTPVAATSAFAGSVTWDFPRTGNCHEGLPFSDGRTGVLVWGGGDTINLTVGRSDLWDHRGGYPWLASQSYTNIVAAVESGDAARLLGLFKKETPNGEPRNPYMLPFGRVVVRLDPKWELASGELDTATGLGRLHLREKGSSTLGKPSAAIEIAMSKRSGTFAMRFPEGVGYGLKSMPSTSFPVYERDLKPVGFERATVVDGKVPGCGGFRWKLPADEPAWLTWDCRGRECAVRTGRGDELVAEAGGRFDVVAAESVERWAAFWAEGARVKVPDPVLQRVFDYGMYRFGAMTDPGGVPAGLQGPWLEDDRLVPWNGDYHFNINVQECYSPAYRGGHFANLMPLFRMVLSWRGRLRDNAEKFAGIGDGYVLPHSVDDRGVCIGGFWTGTIDHGSTAWVADMMFRYVRHSGDLAFLKSDAYDFMRGAMNVYRAMMEERGGRLSFPLGPSPEWGAADVRKAVGRDPSFQLAACHRLARNLIAAAELLGEKPEAMWLDVERRLPLYTAHGNVIGLFEGQGLTESHRHHSHLAGFYPFDVIPLEKKLAGDTFSAWTRQGTGLWTGWCVPWAAVLNLHVGNAEAAVGLLRAWDRYFCDEGHGSHHNAVYGGFTSWSNGRGVMQMDGQCAAAAAVMELLVHEVEGKTEYFRGCPREWKDVSFENVSLSDGRRANGRRVNGKAEVEVIPR